MTRSTNDTHSAVGHDGLRNIALLGDLLDDLQSLRIRNGNRAAASERLGVLNSPLADLNDGIKAMEHDIELSICRAWRRHPLAPWAKTYLGLGEKSIARLIAVIGDPLIGSKGRWVQIEGEAENAVETEEASPTLKRIWEVTEYYERSLSQLRAYCGHGAALKRTKGMSQEEALRLGNPKAKKQIWLIATSMLKAGNRAVYDARRLETADRVDAEGVAWTKGHAHADALRITGKQFLADLYDAAHALEVPLADAA